MAVAAVRGEGRRCEQGRAGTGPGPGRRSVEGAGKRAETSRRSARDWGAGRGAETWLQLGARIMGPELGCGAARLRPSAWLLGLGGGLIPGCSSLCGS